MTRWENVGRWLFAILVSPAIFIDWLVRTLRGRWNGEGK